MTEAEWLACDEPDLLLDHFHLQASPRKRRLLALAICRHVLGLVSVECAHRAAQIAEQFADGQVRLGEMLVVSEEVGDAYVAFPRPCPVNDDPPLSFKAESVALQSFRFLTSDRDDFLGDCFRCTSLATLRWATMHAKPGEEVPPYESLVAWQIHLIREVFGNPFQLRPVPPFCRTLTVSRLAEGIYTERTFGELPYLADALEDAGCADNAILSHLRGPGPHVRGCWAVDLILDKV